MARYVDIECDAVIEVLPRRAFKTRQDIRDFLDNIPTADVAPVVHGHWIKRGGSWYCSYCDKGYRITCGSVAANNHRFCPNCGAVMDGGVDDG